jgi:hypothetical protein
MNADGMLAETLEAARKNYIRMLTVILLAVGTSVECWQKCGMIPAGISV